MPFTCQQLGTCQPYSCRSASDENGCRCVLDSVCNGKDIQNAGIFGAYAAADIMPLGSGALCATTYPLDREMVADELGFETVIFDELDEQAWVVQQSGDYHWQSGFALPRILLDSECVVQTCNLKTHRYGGHFTLSLKNSVGLVARTVRTGSYNYMEELHNSPHQREMIAEVNAAYTPSLIVMDGVDAFVDGGPATGRTVSPSVVIAGSDPVAIDAVGVAILRLFGTTPQVSRGKVFEQEQIARAVELGLGIDAPERIRIVTGDSESEAYARQISQYLI